jgi:thiol peroxidase
MTATTERSGAVTMKGDPKTLVGEELQVGQKAPDFELTGTDMAPKRLDDFAGKVKILEVVPSLDTSVCDQETRTFNEKAASLGDDIAILTISMDLPMAQNRWCGAAGVDRVTCLSDYKDHRFGYDYGLRIKELGLLARTVIVVDQNNVIRYMELVSEIAEEPDYAAALKAAQDLVQ